MLKCTKVKSIITTIFFSAKFITLKQLMAVRKVKITNCFPFVAAQVQAGMWGCVSKILCVLKLLWMSDSCSGHFIA